MYQEPRAQSQELDFPMASPKPARSKSKKADEVARLRVLAHDLSNSLEAILQATYLLQQAKLEGDSQRWVDLIDSSSQEAARINGEIREALRAFSGE
jgi:signal transduction histidine kinase